MTIRVQRLDVANDRVVERFLALRDEIYADDDHWCRPVDGTLPRELRRPEFAGRQQIFMVRRPGRDVGCAVVRRCKRLTIDGQNVATIGHFEALHDPEAVSALLEESANWAMQEGAELVVGPMNGDAWHRFRCNCGPWDEAPFWMEPHNPSYYSELWQQAGFEAFQTYQSRRVDDIKGAARHHQPRWAQARSLGYCVESMTDDGSVDEALDRIYDMICAAYTENRLYSPIRRATFKKRYDGLDEIVDGDLSIFLVGPDGEDAGFALVVPDYGAAVSAMDGRRDLWARAKFLVRRGTDTANVRSFAVMPQHRGQGLASAMAHKYYEAIADHGYECVNLCMLDDNDEKSRSADADRGRILRRYVLYRYPSG